MGVSRNVKKFLMSLITCLSLAAVAAAEFRDVTADYRAAFPRDIYFNKDFRVQWWYLTGHLSDDTGREFGYQLTFFVVGIQRRKFVSAFGVDNIYISHFALSDVQKKKYYFADRADAGAFGYAGAKEEILDVWVGSNILEGSMDRMKIVASGSEGSIDLVLKPAKPVILHGDKGYSRKSVDSPLHASIYFSYTRMETEGTLRIGARTFPVKGQSWFDREMSTEGLSRNKAGWDWFSLQLDDGREVMLYLIRNKDGSIDRYSSGTVVLKDGRSLHLAVGDFRVMVKKLYRSEKTGARYPSAWEIAVPSQGLQLRVMPLIEDQEFIAVGTTGNVYWEGACSVDGTVTGRAYVELTGYK